MNKIMKVLSCLVCLLCIGSMALAVVPSITPTPIFENKVAYALGIAQWIGLIIGVVMVIWVGGKYLMAGAGEKAKAKETLVPMLIGAALIALAPTIINTIYSNISSAS